MENEEEKKRLEQEMKEKVLQNMKGLEAQGEFFTFTLKNFAYRYFESETSGPAEIITPKEKCIAVTVKEPHLATALKTPNKVTRQGLIELAKSFSKKEAPSPRYLLGVEIKDHNREGGGDFLLFSEVHWDFPKFENHEKRQRVEKTIHYEDALDLRNNFARHLEEICDVF